MSDDTTRQEPARFDDARGTEIPPYRLLEKLGEGGMGEVWLAEQTEPVRRRVAIKLIKSGMDTKLVIARFEAERQALAMMDHPTIAKVFDAGETPRGLPFFAMEYVVGEPITTYCDRVMLPNEARLQLFRQVCDGVQHAHQKGIIHRDLKPSNVLVSIENDRPLPKIIDFGVAKATAQRLTDKTLFTEIGVLIGTPGYISPEQAQMSGLDIDTRADVYALGVMLYELLTGVLPFDPKALRAQPIDQMLRQIREVDPPRPSTRVSMAGESIEAAQRRQTDPARLVSLLKGELDWIAMKAIEKDRTRRYASASELQADIERYLTDQPVLAGPPSAAYRARKFIRRHRFGVSAATLGVAALVVFGATMAIQAKRIATERDRAEAVSDFLKQMFAGANPIEAQGKTVTARDLLDKGAARIDKELTGQPLVRAQLMVTMGQAYRVMGLCAEASRLLQSAKDIRLENLGADDPDTLISMSELGLAQWCAGNTPEAEATMRRAFDEGKKALGPDHDTTLHAAHILGGIVREQGRLDEAEALYQDALKRSTQTLGANHTLSLAISIDLANVVSDRSPKEAATLMQSLLPRLRETVGENDPLYVVALASSASFLWGAGDNSRATAIAEDAVPRARLVLGDSSEAASNLMQMLATLYFGQGRYENAEALLTTLLNGRERAGRLDDRWIVDAKGLLSRVYSRQRRYAESERLRLDVLAANRRAYGENNATVGAALYNLACITALQGKRNEALDWLQQAVTHGFRDVDSLLKDTDLTSLRNDARFEAIVAQARTPK